LTPRVDGFHAQHQPEVGVRVVVGAQCPRLPGQRRQHATSRAQVARGRSGGVEDVERIDLTVVIAVDAVTRPRGRDELHRPDRAVEDGVPVEPAAVGVADQRRAVAIQRDADDPRGG